MGIKLELSQEMLTYAVIVLAVLVLILIALTIKSIRRSNEIIKRFSILNIRNSEGRKLIDLLEEQMTTTTKIATKFGAIGKKLTLIEDQLTNSFQKIGIVRYNPFPGSGGELSYSLALLDYSNSGFIFTGIFSRESCFTYVKPIEDGKSIKYKLSSEEEKALQIAKDYAGHNKDHKDIEIAEDE